MLDNIFDFINASFNSYISRKDGSLKILPFLYVLEITHRCNLGCDFCYVGKKDYKNELALSNWKEIINQLPFYGFASLSGGEPLLHPDFFEILSFVQKRLYGKVNVFSNGLLLNSEVARELVKRKLLLINISIDGIGATHDKLRNREGAYDKVISNIENLISLRKRLFPFVDIQSVVLNENISEIPKVYELIAKLGCNFHTIALVNNTSLRQSSVFSDNLTDTHCVHTYPLPNYLDFQKLIEMYKELMSLQKKYRIPIRFKPSFQKGFDFCNIERFLNSGNKSVADIYKPCNVMNSRVFVNPKGIVYPCLSLNMGNVNEQSNLFEILNSEKYRVFRKKIRDEKLINACQLCCDLVVKK